MSSSSKSLPRLNIGFLTVADMQSNTIKLKPFEGLSVRTAFYNTAVICDWVWTKTPDANAIKLPITANSGWYAVLVPFIGTILSPEMTGAYGDFSQQDHVAVQTCLDYFENNAFYGEVKVNKNYLVGDTIEGRAYASMTGFGEFKAKDLLDKTVIDINSVYPTRKIQNVTYRGFRIDGNASNQLTADKLLGAGFALRCDVNNPAANGDTVNHSGELENITIENITSNNCVVNGFYFGKNTFVHRGYAFNLLKAKNNVNGIFLDDFCEYITFGQVILQLNQYGVRDNGASNISFIGGMSNNNTEAGFYIEKTARNTSKKIINGMHINHNKRGVWIGSGVGAAGVQPDHIIITSNHILANISQGVVGSGGQDVTVKGNDFSGNGHGAPGTLDDIYIGLTCQRWDVDNTHINSTGQTRHAVYYVNRSPQGVDSHSYHKIDGAFNSYAVPIGYLPNGNPSSTPLNANVNFVQGVFEYYNAANNPPMKVNASGAAASVNTDLIPFGTICINNVDATGNEQWLATRPPSSAGAGIGVVFKRVAAFV